MRPLWLLRYGPQSVAECFVDHAPKRRATLLSEPIEKQCDVFINGEGCPHTSDLMFIDVLMSRSCAFFPGDDGLLPDYIVSMESILPILFGAAMLATVGVLFAGVISFAFNTKVNAKYSNKLMTARVICQAVAVALFGAMVLLHVI